MVNEKLQITNCNDKSAYGNFFEAIVSAIKDDSDLDTTAKVLSSLLCLGEKSDEEIIEIKGNNINSKIENYNFKRNVNLEDFENNVINSAKEIMPAYEYIFNIFSNAINSPLDLYVKDSYSPFDMWEMFMKYEFNYSLNTAYKF